MINATAAPVEKIELKMSVRQGGHHNAVFSPVLPTILPCLLQTYIACQMLCTLCLTHWIA